MMVRLVPCGVRECRQAVIDRERERGKETITNKKRKEGRKEGREGGREGGRKDIV